MKKKILFNCTSNISGGTLQNAVNFIAQSLNDEDIIFFYAVSKNIAKSLKKQGVSIPEDRLYVFQSRPSFNLFERRKLAEIQKKLNPSMVFTMAGPAYVKFNCLHIMGITDPYLLGFDYKVWKNERSYLQLILKIILSKIKTRYAKLADIFLFQTKSSQSKFKKLVKNIDEKKSFIVPNSVNSNFLDKVSLSKTILKEENESLIILCPAAYYPHKCLSIVVPTAKELKKKITNFRIKLTIDSNSPAYRFIKKQADIMGVAKHIETIGSYDNSESHKIHEKAHIIFIPSLLEVFSTSYLEAIASHRRIICSDLDFAREICQEFSDYFEPLNAKSASDCILKISQNLPVEQDEIEERIKFLSSYGDQKKRYKLFKQILVNAK